MIVIKNVYGGSVVVIKNVFANAENLVIVYNGGDPITIGGGGGGVTDHGALTGLADDDHSQYHNDTRGDARYILQTVADANQDIIRTGTNPSSFAFLRDGNFIAAKTDDGKNIELNPADLSLYIGNGTNQIRLLAPVLTGDRVVTLPDATGTVSLEGHTHVKADITDFGTYAAPLGVDDNYVTDAEKTKLANLSGTNTGDQDLSTKQDTLVSGTNIKTVNGASLLGSTNIATYEDLPLIMTGLGWTGKAQTFDAQLMTATSFGLTNQELDLFSIYLREAATLTGVGWLQVTNGNYTANNYNGVGLYSYSGGTITLVASSTDDANIWQPGSTGYKQKAFSSTYAAAQGVYYIGLLYCRSAAVTAPAIGNKANGPTTLTSTPFTNSAKLCGFVGSRTSLIASQAMSGVSNQATYPWLALY